MDEANERQPLLTEPKTRYTDEANEVELAEDRDDSPVDDGDEEEELDGTRIVACGASKSLLGSIGGIVLVMIAGFAFTGSNVLQKFEVPELTFWQMLMNRALVQTTLMLIVCERMHKRYRPEEGFSTMFMGPEGTRKRTVLQGFLGGVLLCCMFVAVKIVPLGNCSAIMFCTPIFTFFLAPLMIRERFGLYRVLISICMLFGVVFITRPNVIFGSKTVNVTSQFRVDSDAAESFMWYPDEAPNGFAFQPIPQYPIIAEDHRNVTLFASPFVPLGSNPHNHTQNSTTSGSEVIIGYTTCIAVPFLSALISIITRQCNIKKVPIYNLMLWFGIGSLMVAVFGPLALGVDEGHLFDLSSTETTILLSITILGLLGNMSYTLAVKFVSPSLANVFRSFEVILNFVLQVELEHTTYYNINAVGIALLLTAVVVMSFERTVKRKYGHKIKWL